MHHGIVFFLFKLKFDDGFCGGDVVTSNLGVLKAYVESREDCTYSI